MLQLMDIYDNWFCIGHVSDFEINKPYNITYFDTKYALWKSQDNTINIIQDKCPHAGASLSNGFICSERGTIVCPYHRFEFDNNGCQKVDLNNGAQTHEELNCANNKDIQEVVVSLSGIYFEIENGFIWLRDYGYYPDENTPDIPSVFSTISSDINFHLTEQFTFDSKVNPLHFIENLCDIQHFAGSHFDTIFSDRIDLENYSSNKNEISFTFSIYKKLLTLKDILLNPILFLFPDKIDNTAIISVPNCFGIKAQITNKSYVLTYIIWYPETENRFRVKIYFFESAKLNPVIELLLRKNISNTRQKTINEDRTILQSISPDHVNRSIWHKNDAIIRRLRKILVEQFNVKIDES